MEKYGYKIETQKGVIVARGVLVGSEDDARNMAGKMLAQLKSELDVEYMVTIRGGKVWRRKSSRR